MCAGICLIGDFASLNQSGDMFFNSTKIKILRPYRAPLDVSSRSPTILWHRRRTGNLLGGIALTESWQRLTDVIVGRTWRRVLSAHWFRCRGKPKHPPEESAGSQGATGVAYFKRHYGPSVEPPFASLERFNDRSGLRLGLFLLKVAPVRRSVRITHQGSLFMLGPKAGGLSGAFYGNAYIMLTLTTMIWAGNAVAGRLAIGEVSPMSLVLLRWVGVVVLMGMVSRKKVINEWPVLRQRLWFLFALGAVGFTIFNGLFYIAAHSTVAINMGILQGSIPVFVLMGALLVYGTRVSPCRVLAFC